MFMHVLVCVCVGGCVCVYTENSIKYHSSGAGTHLGSWPVNLRNPPETTSPALRSQARATTFKVVLCRLWGSNSYPGTYKSRTLPTKLSPLASVFLFCPALGSWDEMQDSPQVKHRVAEPHAKPCYWFTYF